MKVYVNLLWPPLKEGQLLSSHPWFATLGWEIFLFAFCNIGVKDQKSANYSQPQSCHQKPGFYQMGGFQTRYGMSIKYTCHSQVLFVQKEYSQTRIFL